MPDGVLGRTLTLLTVSFLILLLLGDQVELQDKYVRTSLEYYVGCWRTVRVLVGTN